MTQNITIDGRAVPFSATASTIRRYRRDFGRDLLLDFKALQEEIDSDHELTASALTIFEDLAYTMAKQADPNLPPTPDEWLDTFEMFSIYQVLPQILALWKVSELPTAEAKKKATT